MDPNDIIKVVAAMPIAAIVRRILGPATDELAEVWRDKVQAFRYERQAKLLEKAATIAKASGFTPQAVPPRILFPLLEGASLEDDEDLHTMWAALLANAASPEAPALGGISIDPEIISRPESSGVLVDYVAFSPELLHYLQEDPERLRVLTPEQFEHFVADCLDRTGYNVRLTGSTHRKDGGVDLIAVPKASDSGSVVIAAQIKHHRADAKTGREAVDRMMAWKDSVFGVGLLVTNTQFTRDAVWAAQKESNRHFIRLRDSTDIQRWLTGRFRDESDLREIPDSVELAPGVVVKVPKPNPASKPEIKRRPAKPKG